MNEWMNGPILAKNKQYEEFIIKKVPLAYVLVRIR